MNIPRPVLTAITVILRNLSVFLLVPCLFGNLQAPGQEIRYPVSAIDSALLTNASMIVRWSERIITINSLNSESIATHLVLTILKGSALHEASCFINYNNWSDVDRFEGVVYDAHGRPVKKLGKKEITDQSAIEDGTLYSDERVKFIRPVVAQYPFTVEYFVKQSFRHKLVYPSWSPRDSYNSAVESAQLVIHAGEGLFPRTKALRMPENAVISGDGKLTMSWETRNLPAIADEPLSPPLSELSPVIYLEPVDYSVKGYAGDFSSWKSFGGWVATLQESRDTLDAAMHAKVNSLVSGAENNTEKTRRIYRYMQSTCRYVSVNVGIGGIQSEKAEKVARLGYGDCKGLVNYTAALLHAAGIPSHYTLVRSGDNAEAIQNDFPGNQFNHIILCVPAERDTIWLECTNMHMPFSFLGNFTDDRDVLVVTPDGGFLTRTPVYTREQNTSSRITRIMVDSAGNATARIRSIYQGLQFEPVMDLPYMAADEQKETLRKQYKVPGVEFGSVSYKSHGERLPVMEEQVTAAIPKFSPVSGNRMFLSLNGFLDNPGTFPKDDRRRSDVVITYPYIDSDTVVIQIPPGYKVESKPPPADLKSQFCRLKSEVKAEGQTITLYRRFEMEKGRYPADQYSVFVDFMRQVARQDKSKVVVVK